MSDQSVILSLPYLLPGQAQKHVTHNEALRLLDGIVQLGAESRVLAFPPAAVAGGARFLVAPGATGDWAGQDHAVAVHDDGAWHFTPPGPGWLAWVADEARLVVFDAAQGWQVYAPPVSQTAQLGINTGADAVNRLAVASAATLFSHEGSGHQLKINKAGTADTASLLYQTGWSGRAEMGLAGTDDFSIKTSADGATWAEALRADAASGTVTLPQGAVVEGALTGSAVTQEPQDTTPERLIRVQDGYVKGSILGTVSQTGGVPTGAILERGSNANGTFMRYADGTQICISPNLPSGAVTVAIGALFRSESITWSFPIPFAAPPAVSGTAGNAGRWLTIAQASEGSTFLRVFSPSTSAISTDARLIAMGNWY